MELCVTWTGVCSPGHGANPICLALPLGNNGNPCILLNQKCAHKMEWFLTAENWQKVESTSVFMCTVCWRSWHAMTALQVAWALFGLFILMPRPASVLRSFTLLLAIYRCVTPMYYFSLVTVQLLLYGYIFHKHVSRMAPPDWINRGKWFALLLGNIGLCIRQISETRRFIFCPLFEKHLHSAVATRDLR